MKKYIVLFSIVVQLNYAMELSETRSLAVNATSKKDYQCYWVARYLNKCWHKLDNSEKKQVDNFYQQSPLADQVMSYQNSMKESDEEAEDFLQKVWDKTIYDAYQILGGIMSTKHKNDDYNAFGKIAFAHPGLRRNAQDQPFTLGDLVNKEIPAV